MEGQLCMLVMLSDLPEVKCTRTNVRRSTGIFFFFNVLIPSLSD